MQKVILNEMQLRELVSANRYKIDQKTKFLSRCIDGRYPNVEGLPALAIPGADAGEMAMIFAAGNSFGFEVDPQKTLTTLTDLLGGIKNIQFHTDCGYLREISKTPEDFNLTPDEVDFIKKKLIKAKEKGAKEVVFQGEHREAAIVLVKGDYGLTPQYLFKTDAGDILSSVFVFHQTLVDQRHKVLADKLIKNKAIKLYQTEFTEDDKDYIYTTLTETVETHLFEIAKKLASKLPIYHLNFEDSGEFEIKEMGKV